MMEKELEKDESKKAKPISVLRKDEVVINNVMEYLEQIHKINNEWREADSIIVYRGEPVCYPTPGMPGIFREKENLEKNRFFEKNLLLEISANKLSAGRNYLEIAIDSQHGGFPSRLLDVTFNCLIALYFACVSQPKNEEKERIEHGRVLIYKLDKAYCPTASNAIDNYKELVDNPDTYLNHYAFEKNHKLVDHIKLNQRIIAQQGGLILFQGMNYETIPDWMTKSIAINPDEKDTIKGQLQNYFGINTSFVYPEIDNAVDKIKIRANKIYSVDLSLKNEIVLCIENEKKFIEYELEGLKGKTIQEQQETIVILEKNLKTLKDDIKSIIEKEYKDEERANAVSESRLIFNNLINDYATMFLRNVSNEFETSYEDLIWEE